MNPLCWGRMSSDRDVESGGSLFGESDQGIDSPAYYHKKDTQSSLRAEETDVSYFYINLSSAVERRASAEKQARDFGIDLQRIEAIAGRDLAENSLSSYDRKRRRQEFASDLTMNEHACILSHCKALRAFLDSGAEYGVILEDDFVLQAHFRESIDYLTRRTSGWQCLKLYTGDGQLFPLGPRRPDAPVRLVFPKKLPWVAVGTLYTRAGALLTLDGFRRYWMGYDVQWAWHLLSGRIPVCGVSPSLVTTSDPNNEASTIDAGDPRDAHFRTGRQEQTWRQYAWHRLAVWRMSWGKWRMRRSMKHVLRVDN